MSVNHFFVNGYYGSVEIDLINRKYYHNSNKQNDAVNDTECIEDFVNPSTITNAVITIGKSKKNLKYLDLIFEHLEYLLCKYIVIDFEEKCYISDLSIIFSNLNKYNIHEALLLLKYSDELYSDRFADIVLSSDRYKSIIIFNSPFDKNLENVIHYYRQEKKFNYNKNALEFIPIRELYVESLHYHTYFNRKLYIGSEGEIKNAKETNTIFGYIYDFVYKEELEKIINSNEFQEYWTVNKEKCDVCKDCEYRYMCVDNRLPYKRNDNEWYHKIECNYNPYICKWSYDKNYKTLSECGIISNEQGFFIDNRMLNHTNS